jgi:hypothetical protein
MISVLSNINSDSNDHAPLMQKKTKAEAHIYIESMSIIYLVQKSNSHIKISIASLYTVKSWIMSDPK